MPFLKIHSYALEGKLEELKHEIEKELAANKVKTIKEVIELCTDDGETPLILAIMGGHPHVVKYLIEQGSNLKVCSGSYIATPLHLSINLTAQQLESGKNPELFYAIIRMILQKDISLINVPDQTLLTPYDIVNTLRREHPEIKMTLLQIIREINHQHPLLLLEELVQQLQQKIEKTGLENLDFYVRDFVPSRLTPSQQQVLIEIGLHYFEIRGEPPSCYKGNIAYFLFSNKEQKVIDYAKMWNPHIAAANGYREIMLILLNKGLDPNLADDKFGTTLLSKASFSKHTQMVQLLLEKGALASRINRDGKTALQYLQEAFGIEAPGEIVELLTVAQLAEKSACSRPAATPIESSSRKTNGIQGVRKRTILEADKQKNPQSEKGYSIFSGLPFLGIFDREAGYQKLPVDSQSTGEKPLKAKL